MAIVETVYTSPNFGCWIVQPKYLPHQVLVGWHSDQDPSDQDWQAWIHASKTILDQEGEIRALVCSLGGKPNTTQRADINKLLGDRPQRISVLLDSRIVRGVVQALNWFNPSIQAFSLHDLSGACTHLNLDEDAQAAIGDILNKY